MNVFFQEIRINLRSLGYWCATMLFLVGACMGKTSGMIKQGGQSIEVMMKLMPKAIQNLFGLGMVDFSKVIGIFAVVALYIALIAAFHASGLGVAAFAREERDRTFEFLYVRGRTRGAILAAKVLADALMMLALSALTFIASVVIVRAVDGSDIAAPFFPMMLGVMIIQAVSYSLGLLVSLLTHRMRLATSVTSGIIMALFLLYMLGMAVDPDMPIMRLSPFRSFDGKLIFKDGLNAVAAAVWLLASAAMVCAAFWLHKVRDLHT